MYFLHFDVNEVGAAQAVMEGALAEGADGSGDILLWEDALGAANVLATF